MKADRIYRINSEIKFGGNYLDIADAVPLLGPDMVRELPGVEQYTRLQYHGSIHVRKGNDNLQEDRVEFADSTLFSVFTLPMIDGNTARDRPEGAAFGGDHCENCQQVFQPDECRGADPAGQ